ncbi:MAG TPA: pirin family protein [Anaerolineales bacterium]|nr:pirin family protein [Anaerolineales bacterium]
MDRIRTLNQVIEPRLVIEGAGVLLRRSIAPSRENPHDPFLLFDHFAFNDPIEGPIAGFPMHPHRGIETVTYMLEGSVQHRDSLGNAGRIGPGDVQWMTSGRGILHEEMPRRSPEGNVLGFQLWVNLPAARKMDPPRYQEIQALTIPGFRIEDATVRLVAGSVGDRQGPVTEIAAAPVYLEAALEPGARFTMPLPAGHTTVAYLFEGAIDVPTQDRRDARIESVRLLVFADGDIVRIKAPSDTGARFMLMAGAPYGEPIVPYGPFVMNTDEEIRQALADLRNGTFVTA